jgi:TM2 domain-containing membrane protein YozV
VEIKIMFNIIGADGKQYGPISADLVRQWIREGRANGQTQVQPVDGGAWVPLASLAEFASALATPASPPPVSGGNRAEKKIAAGLCGILLGGLGVHKFILGYNGAGGIMLGVTLGAFVLMFLTCGITVFLVPIMNIIGLIEGIIYLTKSDEEFVRTYVDGRKEWF